MFDGGCVFVVKLNIMVSVIACMYARVGYIVFRTRQCEKPHLSNV